MLHAKPPPIKECPDPKEGDIDEDNFWKNLTEGELIDIDLFTACAIGEFDYVKEFINNAKPTYGTDIVNNSNKSGWTPLMYVCFVGNDKITELLIREGADVLFEEHKHGFTPLMLASSSGNISLVKRLVENNARINQEDKRGQTALFYAAEHGQTNIVKYLLSINADVLIRQKGTGYTAFMEAAKQGHEGVFSAFLEHGVYLDLVCNKGYTARDLAKQFKYGVIVNMIDNHCYKFPTLRYEADLSDLGMDEIKQPDQKVNEWLNDQNPHHIFDDILSDKLFEMRSHAIAIDDRFKTYSVGESFGRSVGDSTIDDSERTPVGTPVDSVLQQYMIMKPDPCISQGRSHHEQPSLETFLKNIGLEKYLKTFQDQSIDFDMFIQDLTEEDFKELGIKFGPSRKLTLAINKWNHEKGWQKNGSFTAPDVDNLKLQLADAYSKLQHEIEARASLEAEQMEGRARRNHTYFIVEKVLRACKDLQNTNITLKKHIETLKTAANEKTKENLQPKLEELHKQMSENTINTDNITETIIRRVEKLLCEDVTELSSSSDSPESSCTSFSKSESGSGV
ncbi:ankyrin repeat and SAM domain-containing protein 3-like [Dendronephthya gigantea]|uniref:ankyrin repeat and SAM domain-containing protein 3-like n=1 Tax=Dendronephthya gigantea TaxID=151771 RepID=UPI001068F08E|nr:ankyrin repeat and SAM domain-containing protein 3-like [Dendronephthya gigantea]